MVCKIEHHFIIILVRKYTFGFVDSLFTVVIDTHSVNRNGENVLIEHYRVTFLSGQPQPLLQPQPLQPPQQQQPLLPPLQLLQQQRE